MSKIVETKVGNALIDYYLPFAKYVNQTRALPDARDGLKMGARYLIYAMYADGLVYNKKARKAQATVAAGMRFSPHGDSSVYGTAIRLSQHFSTRYPLMSVVGNYGTQSAGKDFAAMRYLEMKSNEIAHEMTKLLEKDAVLPEDWRWNYTNEEKYPSYFPSLFPYVVNGNSGMGVGMSSSIPSWNLREFCDSAVKLWRNPATPFEELVCYPDFPTYGIVLNKDEVTESLRIGKGKAAILRGRAHYEVKKNEIVIDQLPYQVFAENVVKQISELIETGKLPGVTAVIDASDKDHDVQIVVELEKGANFTKILGLLYKETSLQFHYTINMMMLENGKTPRLYGFKDILQNYLSTMSISYRRANEFDLEKAKNRLEIVEGYILALGILDEVIAIIRGSASVAAAKAALVKEWKFTEKQADAILDMKLSRLTSMEREKLENELAELREKVTFLTKLLTDDKFFHECMEKEIYRIRDTFGDERRTEIGNFARKTEEDEPEVPMIEEDFVLSISNEGLIHCEKLGKFQTIGKGKKGTKLKTKEYLIDVLCVSNTEKVLALSDCGRAYTFAGASLVEGTDVHISQLIEKAPQERIVKLLPYKRFGEYEGVIFLTKNGLIKITAFKDLEGHKAKGVSAIKVKEDDAIVSVLLAKTLNQEILVATKNGYFARYSLEEVRPTGRAAMGVKSIVLRTGDEVATGCVCATNAKEELLTITNNGIGKRTSLEEYSLSGRAVKGSLIQQMKEGDTLASVMVIEGDADLLVASPQTVSRIRVADISLVSRASQGNTIMKEPGRILYLGQAID